MLKLVLISTRHSPVQKKAKPNKSARRYAVLHTRKHRVQTRRYCPRIGRIQLSPLCWFHLDCAADTDSGETDHGRAEDRRVFRQTRFDCRTVLSCQGWVWVLVLPRLHIPSASDFERVTRGYRVGQIPSTGLRHPLEEGAGKWCSRSRSECRFPAPFSKLPELVTPLKGHSFYFFNLHGTVHRRGQSPPKGLGTNKTVEATKL